MLTQTSILLNVYKALAARSLPVLTSLSERLVELINIFAGC